MIGMIEGQVRRLSAPTACIMTSSGVGYDIDLTLPAFCQLQLGSKASVWTHMHVREDAQLLYGFLSSHERDAFRQLIRINGVGAKMALAMMSTMTVFELKQVVDLDNEAMLIRVPGIGKKTAQRLLIELKGKFDAIIAGDDLPLGETDENSELALLTSINVNQGRVSAEVEAALISLGYRDKEAQQAIKLAKQTYQDDQKSIDKDHIANSDTNNSALTLVTELDTQALLKLTLKSLSGF